MNARRVMPQREGIFWGRGVRQPYFDLIVHINGEPPYLRIDIFHFLERRLQKDASPNAIVEWGPEVEDMSQYSTDQAWKFAMDDWRIEDGVE